LCTCLSNPIRPVEVQSESVSRFALIAIRKTAIGRHILPNLQQAAETLGNTTHTLTRILGRARRIDVENGADFDETDSCLAMTEMQFNELM
jgi:hypothetical protein